LDNENLSTHTQHTDLHLEDSTLSTIAVGCHGHRMAAGVETRTEGFRICLRHGETSGGYHQAETIALLAVG